MRARPSLEKRRKEEQRQERKREKAQRRKEKRSTSPEDMAELADGNVDPPANEPRLTSTGGVDFSAFVSRTGFPPLGGGQSSEPESGKKS